MKSDRSEMTLPQGCSISAMRVGELSTLAQWAADEGWNPGLSDLRIASEADPEAFVALREGDELLGAGSIYSYDGHFGFMGLFIIRADLRNRGLGSLLWHWRRDRLLARLKPGATICMDGVFDMVPFYERGGFKRAFRDLRYQGKAKGSVHADVVELSSMDIHEIEVYDRFFVPAPRKNFIAGWISAPRVITMGVRLHDKLAGYGVARPCRVGFKIGPLFADSPLIAKRIADSLMVRFAGDLVQMDLPEANPSAITLADQLGLNMSFGCMRLYYGAAPSLPIDRTFAVTSLEFG